MQESVLTAARRVVRFFNIDMNKGGIITVETQRAVETLNRMVVIETAREKAATMTTTTKGKVDA